MSINKSISLGVLADKQQMIMQQDIDRFSQGGNSNKSNKDAQMNYQNLQGQTFINQQQLANSYIPVTNSDNQAINTLEYNQDDQDDLRNETEEQNLINQLISILGNEEYKLQIPDNLKNEALALLRTKMIINNQTLGGQENNSSYNQAQQILNQYQQGGQNNGSQSSLQNTGTNSNQNQQQQQKLQQLQQQLNNQYGLNQELINQNEDQDRIEQLYSSEKNKNNQQNSNYQTNFHPMRTEQNKQSTKQEKRYSINEPTNDQQQQHHLQQQQPVSFACSPQGVNNIMIPTNLNDPKSIINVNDLLNKVNPKQQLKGSQDFTQINQQHLDNITEEPSFSNSNSNTKYGSSANKRGMISQNNNQNQNRQSSTSPLQKNQKGGNQNERGRTNNNNNNSSYGYSFSNNNNSLLNNTNASRNNELYNNGLNQNPRYLANLSDSGKKRTASSSVKKISRSFYSQNNNNNNFNSTAGSTILNNSFTYVSNSGNSQNYQLKLLNKMFQNEKENNQNEISDLITPQKNSSSLNKRQRTMTHSHSLNKTFAQPSKQQKINPSELKKLKISTFQNFSQGAIGKLQILENEIKSSSEQKRILQEQINQLRADIVLEKKWQEESILNNQVLQNQMNNINKNCSMLMFDGAQKKKLLVDYRLEIKEIENEKEQIMNKIDAINQQTKQEKEYIYTYKVLIEEIKKQIKNEQKLRNDLKVKVQNNQKNIESLHVKKDALPINLYLIEQNQFNKNCTIIQSVEKSLNRYFEKS